MTLNEVEEGVTCTIVNLDIDGTMRRRFQDLGMIIGTKVIPIKKSPHGGLTAYKMRESIYAIRQEDAKHIQVIV